MKQRPLVFNSTKFIHEMVGRTSANAWSTRPLYGPGSKGEGKIAYRVTLENVKEANGTNCNIHR